MEVALKDRDKVPPLTNGDGAQTSRRQRNQTRRRLRGHNATRRSMATPDVRRRDIILRHRKKSVSKLHQVINKLPEELVVTESELDALESLFGELPKF